MLKKLGFINIIYLALCYLLTKILYNKQKLIRFPFEVRGKRFILFGNRLSTGRYCRIEAYPENNEKVLFIGDDCQINDSVHIVAKQQVILKNNVLLASRVFISDLNHGSYTGEVHTHPHEIAAERVNYTKPVIIGNNVWVGEGAVILAGVTVGDNSIIGANSVVCKDIDANSIYVGNPAKKIKYYDFKLNKWISSAKQS
ncbi:DapH/DapD/GlmU-related protein [Pseudoalteromonas sp. SG45-1]|uniref:DapH/DapD/GlmU-related protein n=1 Tax=Pseudoalteromonas sp. SG45-1 TaxID=2760957 RepID=UPI0016011CAC|nr:DapH/DapD/GlmU-related protein [Pseudoalteromonas sp. SG45-1]MBB1400978.1 acetyltransferase [Pseudoalteromonas sp. SG45-1]